jgi:hypothetical protein
MTGYPEHRTRDKKNFEKLAGNFWIIFSMRYPRFLTGICD